MLRDEQLVALILKSCAIKPLQKKRVQQDDVLKRAPVKPQTMETDSCINLRKATVSSSDA